MTSIIAMTFLIGFTANNAYATSTSDSNDIPSPSKTVDFSQFAGINFLRPPQEVGGLVGESITFTDTTGRGLIHDSSYTLGPNGLWTSGRVGFAGNNVPNNPIQFTFNDGAVCAVGGLVNYNPSQQGSYSLIAYDQFNNVLETFDLVANAPISTPGQRDAGEFRGIVRTDNDIAKIELSGGPWGVIDDMKFSRSCSTLDIDKFYTHTNNNWDRVCTEFEDIVQPDGSVVTVCVADRLANINTEDVFADNLDQNAVSYLLFGDEKKTKTVVTPGQYIAVSVIDVLEEQDVWVEEDFSQCLEIGHVNPNKVPGGVQVVRVDSNGDVHDIDDDLAAGIGGSITLNPTNAVVHVEDVPADSQLRVMVKFQPNDDLGMIGLTCENFENLLDVNGDTIDSASAMLTIIQKP